MLIRHVEVHNRELKEDHVDKLHVEVTTRSMAQKKRCVYRCTRAVMLVVVLYADRSQVKLFRVDANVQYGWVLIPTSVRCLKSVSVATCLVKMSAGFASVLILTILTMSLSTNWGCEKRGAINM